MQDFLIANELDKVIAFRRAGEPPGGIAAAESRPNGLEAVAKQKRPIHPPSEPTMNKSDVAGIVAATVAAAQTGTLGVRIPHSLLVRLKTLELELFRAGTKVKVVHLVEMALNDLPAHADSAFIDKVEAFKQRYPRRRPGPRATP